MCFNACQFPMKNYSVNYILFVFFFCNVVHFFKNFLSLL